MVMRNCLVCGKGVYGKFAYCEECFLKIRDNKAVYERIKNEWKLEAKQEDSKYFYFLNEANEILEGKKNMVIGRKGEGKTAIAQYICAQRAFDIFTEKMSFKNFPFNILYKTSDSQYTRPNQYISIWKFLIYSTICKQMIKNQRMDSQLVNNLRKVFPEADNNKKLSNLIGEYTVKEFGFQLCSVGVNASIEKERSLKWIDLIDIFEKVILDNIDDSKYYILFDELDEDYKNFPNDEEKTSYFDLITGLFKAVQDIRSLFAENDLNIYPIVFLRSDIYGLITYSDKNKWSDSIIRLNWTPAKIQELLKHRLNIVLKTNNISFKECWIRLFGCSTMRIGPRQTKKISTFEYIVRSTQNRPRDFIKYFQECAKLALDNNSILIRPSLIKTADSEFSEYMKREIIDEMYAVLPEYEDIFAILSLIRKQTFHPNEFVEKFNQMVEEKKISDIGAEKVLKLLFDFSVIGNVPSIKNQVIFKYDRDAARFNFKENIIVHRGLYKALQIF